MYLKSDFIRVPVEPPSKGHFGFVLCRKLVPFSKVLNAARGPKEHPLFFSWRVPYQRFLITD